MCAVRGAERVVDVAVGVRSEALHELFLRGFHGLLRSGFFVVGGVFGQSAGLTLFFGVETQVFEQQYLARFQCGGLVGGLLALAVPREVHLHAEALLDGGDDVLEREFVFRPFFRTAQVRHQDHRSSFFEYLFDGGDRRTDAGVVGYLQLVVQGHVEIDADNRAFPFEIIRFDRLHG